MESKFQTVGRLHFSVEWPIGIWNNFVFIFEGIDFPRWAWSQLIMWQGWHVSVAGTACFIFKGCFPKFVRKVYYPACLCLLFCSVYKPLSRNLKQWPDVTTDRCQEILPKPLPIRGPPTSTRMRGVLLACVWWRGNAQLVNSLNSLFLLTFTALTRSKRLQRWKPWNRRSSIAKSVAARTYPYERWISSCYPHPFLLF